MESLGVSRVAVVLICNMNYIVPTFATALSARRHISLKNCVVRILVVDADQAWADRFKATGDAHNIEIVAAPLPELDDIAQFHRDRYLPPITLARFWLDRFLEPDIERFLYLDGDILVDDSLDDLLTFPMPTGIMAGPDNMQLILKEHSATLAREKAYLDGIGVDGFSYFNAGVILAMRSAWPEIAHAGVEFLSHHPDLCRSSDQSALNHASIGKVALLPLRYNYQSEHLMVLDPRKIGIKPAIWHFTGGPKPWDDADWPWNSEFNTIFREAQSILAPLNVAAPKAPEEQTKAGLAHRKRSKTRLALVYPWRKLTRRQTILQQLSPRNGIA